MAVGEKVMVSTQLPIVTEAALEVLREGGNAVDAPHAGAKLVGDEEVEPSASCI